MQRDDAVYLRHCVDAASAIGQYLDGVTDAQFFAEPMRQDAVIRQLEIIGEAVKHLSTNVRTHHPHIPWRVIAAMRDRLIHQYFGVDLDQVWLTATTEVPDLKVEMQQILDMLSGALGGDR